MKYPLKEPSENIISANRRRLCSFFIFLVGAIGFSFCSAQAQRYALFLDSLHQEVLLQPERLTQLSQIGFDRIITPKRLSFQAMQHLHNAGFRVSLYRAVHYPTGSSLGKHIKTLQTQIDDLIYARQFSSIDELIVFYQPFLISPAFQKESARWVQELKQQGELQLSVVGGFSIEPSQLHLLNGLHYYTNSVATTSHPDSVFRGLFSSISSPKEFSNELFSKEFALIRANPKARLTLHSGLLIQLLDSNLEITKILSQFNKDSQFLLDLNPLPQVQDSGTRNWISVFLLVVWLSFALHFVAEPTYRRSISRFFFNHSFFASDIFNRHQRMGGSSSILLLQNVAFTGLVSSTIIDTYLSQASLSMIATHWPLLSIFFNWSFGGFLLGLCFQSAISFVQVIWLRYIHPETAHFSQVTPLLAWPTHISFLIVPIILVIILNTDSALAAPWLISGYGLLKIIDFVIASHDIALSTSPKTNTHLRTTLPYILLLVTGYIVFGWYFGAQETWRFAFYLTAIS